MHFIILKFINILLSCGSFDFENGFEGLFNHDCTASPKTIFAFCLTDLRLYYFLLGGRKWAS